MGIGFFYIAFSDVAHAFSKEELNAVRFAAITINLLWFYLCIEQTILLPHLDASFHRFLEWLYSTHILNNPIHNMRS